MPQFHCPHCGQHIDAGDEFAGMTADCPTCARPVIVPPFQQGTPARRPPAVVPTSGSSSTPQSMPEPPALSPPLRARIVSRHEAATAAAQPSETGAPPWVPGSGFTRWAEPLPPWSPEKEEPRSRAWIFVVLTLALGIALSVGGFVWWQNHKGQKPSVPAAGAAGSSAAGVAPPSLPDSQLTVEQLSERQLAQALDSLKLSPEDAAWYSNAWRQSFSRMFNILQDETEHINDDGIDQLFDPERLLHDKLFLESFRMLKVLSDRSKVLIKHLSTVSTDFRDAVVARIPQDKLPKVGRPEPGAALAPLLSQITAAVEQQRRMIDYLKNTFGRWKANEGKFDFRTERDRQDYDRLLDELEKISAEMDRLQGTAVGGGK